MTGPPPFSLTLDGDEPLPLATPVDAGWLAARLRSCADFWIVAEARDARSFVQFAPQVEGRGVYEHWRDGACLYSETMPAAVAEQEAARFIADPSRYRVAT
jgi:hypothetical protein